MDALQFISLFEDFQTQSSRNFIDELEKAFEIGGIVEDKWKKFLFKMKLSGICRQWYYNEYDHFDQEEYKKLKWVDVKKRFLSTFNLFSDENQSEEGTKDDKECFIEENNQANGWQVNQGNEQYCIIENKEENEEEGVKEYNEGFIENTKKSDMYVEIVEDNQMIDEGSNDGEISFEVNCVEKDIWKLNPKEILNYKAENDDKCYEWIKTNEEKFICYLRKSRIRNRKRIQNKKIWKIRNRKRKRIWSRKSRRKRKRRKIWQLLL